MTAAPSLSLRWLATLIFFASGVAGMIDEISWSRQFGNVFGHTVYTGAMVLASFLGGMAIGYWLAGRYGGQSRPLVMYGVLEVVAGIWVCAVPALLQLGAATPLGSLDPGPLGLLSLARVLFCFVLLLPATAALGGTWPYMAAALSPPGESSSAWLSIGYATNTAGAMLGSVLATDYLLVNWGVTRSSYLAAAISIGCGLWAVTIALAWKTSARSLEPHANTGETPPIPFPWWVLAAVSGFSILALEVLYLRLFSLVFHNSTYTFGAVVTVFLFALALGSSLAGLIGCRFLPSTVIAWACGLGALGVTLSIPVFVHWTSFQYFADGGSFSGHLGAVLTLVLAVVLVPVTALGAILPTTWRAIEPERASERQIAGLTAVSTLAGAAGSLAASFFLPVVGLWGSFALIIGVYVLIATGVFWQQRAVGQLLLLGVYMTGGVVISANSLHSVTTTSRDEKLLQRWESAYGWIDAVELPDGSRTVRQNLHYGFGSSRNSVTRDYRSGHLPLLLHREPRDVVFLGMGTGQTAAAALQHPELQSITVVELIPEAVAAARYLKQTNRGLVDDPRVQIQVNDARRFLSGSGRKFDVIVSDLFVPWESHTGYLYTVEHYRAGRAALRSGGLFCQWLPIYQLGPGEFELIANSFAEVFPHTRLWWVRAYANYPVLGLIGSDEPIDFALTTAAQGYLETDPHSGARDEWLADGNAILSYYIGDWPRSQGALLNTDEHPRVEFFAPIAHVDDLKLRKKRVREYFQQVLAKLPQESLRTDNFGGPAQDRAWRLQEQRRLLGID